MADDTRTSSYRVPVTVALVVVAVIATWVSSIAWDICEVNCTFARQKALMYLAIPAAIASLITLAATQFHRLVWSISFGISLVLLGAWLVAALVINP
jgi:hypothetical protein